MTLRFKLTLSFLLISLITALAVGFTAWWMIMQNFEKSAEEEAFKNFQHDIVNYIQTYGSWEAANAAQPFTAFVMQQHRAVNASTSAEHRPPRLAPPFRFLLVSTTGEVLRSVDDYQIGTTIPAQLMKKAYAVRVDNKIHLYAIPIGEPVFSVQDGIYIDYLKTSLFYGLLVAVVIAIVLGMIFGQYLVSNLERLIQALKQMHPDGKMPNKLPVTSKDEIGQLAQTFNQMSELLTECHKKLHELSIRDPLSKLYNRRYFDEHAKNMFNHAKRYNEPLTVMIADIDHFKAVNDTFSHSVGDEVIQKTAEILSTHLRKSDLLARYGGEEFIIVFGKTNIATAKDRCEQLRQQIERYNWGTIAAKLSVTLSLGLNDDTTLPAVEEMIKQADIQLYQAKRNGRNRIEPAA